MKPLLWKELRENLRWMPVGLLVIAAVCWMVHPGSGRNQQLLASALITQLAIVTPLLAFALGVVQAYRDLQPAAGAYLNHREVTSSDLFWAKTVAGFVLYMTSVVLPLIGLALWVGYQGMWWFPMRPAQVLPSFVFALAAFVMHPAAMLMMVRKASWWGTRLFPLVPSGLVLTVFFSVLVRGGISGVAWSLLFAVLTLTWLVLIARRAWQDLACDPPAATTNSELHRWWLLPTYMLLGTIVSFCAAIGAAIGFVETATRSHAYVATPTNALAIEAGSEELWFVTQIQEYDNATNTYNDVILGGEKILKDTEVDAMAGAVTERDFNVLSYSMPLRDVYWVSDGFFTSPNSSVGSSIWYSYDSRGYLLGYEMNQGIRWVKTISADGIYPAGEIVGKPFEGDALGAGSTIFSVLRNEGYPSPLIDHEGVWFVDHDSMELRKVIQMKVDGGIVVPAGKKNAPRLILRSGNELKEYQIVDESGTDGWYTPPELGVSTRNRLMAVKPKLDLKLVRTFTLPDEIVAQKGLTLGWTPQSLVVSSSQHRRDWKNSVAYRLTADGSSDRITFSVDTNSIAKIDDDNTIFSAAILGIMPGLVFLAILAIAIWGVFTDQPRVADPLELLMDQPVAFAVTLLSFLVTMAIAFWLVRRAAYRGGLSQSQTRWWMWSVPLLGLSAPLAIIALYRLVYRETCSECEAPRRIDLSECEHCGDDWQPPEDEGIEIVDRTNSRESALA